MIGISFPSGCHRASSSDSPTVDHATSSRWVCRNESRSSRSSGFAAGSVGWSNGTARIYDGGATVAAGRLDRVERVIVVGPAGSGKTTLARALGAACDLPHTELDALWWDPGWTEVGRGGVPPPPRTGGGRRPVGRLRQLLHRRLAHVAWPRADTIVWVDLAQWRTIARIVLRTIRRSVRRGALGGDRQPRARSAARSGVTSCCASRGVRIRSTAPATRPSARIRSSRTSP